MPSYAWPNKASEPRRTRANVQVGSCATARPCPVSSIGSIRSLRSSRSRASVPSSSDSSETAVSNDIGNQDRRKLPGLAHRAPGARFPTKGDPACDLVCRLWRISLLGARNRERVRSGSSALTTRPAAGAHAAKILRGPAACSRGAFAAFVSCRTFSPASGRR